MAIPSEKRRVTVDLRDPVYDAFAQFAATAYPDRGITDALREAALAFMGTEPLDAARLTARHAAYTAARNELSRFYRDAMAKAADHFQAQHEQTQQEVAEMIAAGILPRAA